MSIVCDKKKQSEIKKNDKKRLDVSYQKKNFHMIKALFSSNIER